MSDEIKALVEQLEAWAPLVSSGYEVPAAGQTMMNASRALTAQADEIERLRVALDTASIRLAHLAGQIEAGFNISGTLRADQAMKARHMADEARAALKAAQEVKA